jgi:hypothetical protein
MWVQKTPGIWVVVGLLVARVQKISGPKVADSSISAH